MAFGGHGFWGSMMKVFVAGVGVGVGFDLAADVGDRFGRGWVVLEWMGTGMDRKMVLIKKSFSKKIIILF